MSGAECGRTVLWVGGLCAVGAAAALLAVLPRDREDLHVGLAGAVALGMLAAAVWYVATVCEAW